MSIHKAGVSRQKIQPIRGRLQGRIGLHETTRRVGRSENISEQNVIRDTAICRSAYIEAHFYKYITAPLWFFDGMAMGCGVCESCPLQWVFSWAFAFVFDSMWKRFTAPVWTAVQKAYAACSISVCKEVPRHC